MFRKAKDRFKLLFASVFVLAFLVMSCEEQDPEQNTLNGFEIIQGWELLFDGKTTRGWHLYNSGTVPSSWIALKGELYCDPYNFEVKHGDLITDKEYRNFDLKFDWKITAEGNSGVFINVQEDKRYPVAYHTGLEYQLIDNCLIGENPFLDDSTRWAGCVYGFRPYQEDVITNPVGQWNEARIQQMNGRVTFWLNDKISGEVDMTTDEWDDMVKNSEFKNYPEFGKTPSGHIGLQYWAKGVSFRNIKIREL